LPLDFCFLLCYNTADKKRDRKEMVVMMAMIQGCTTVAVSVLISSMDNISIFCE
jgi:hypothetical protein